MSYPRVFSPLKGRCRDANKKCFLETFTIFFYASTQILFFHLRAPCQSLGQALSRLPEDERHIAIPHTAQPKVYTQDAGVELVLFLAPVFEVISDFYCFSIIFKIYPEVRLC